MPRLITIKGRGINENSPNRFETRQGLPDDLEDESPHPKTIFLEDSSKTIITYNKSPDIPPASILKQKL